MNILPIQFHTRGYRLPASGKLLHTGYWSVQLLRIETGRNMYRHWSLSWEPTLFEAGALVRRWGRLGTYTRTALLPLMAPEDAWVWAARQTAAKLRRGYVVRTVWGNGHLILQEARARDRERIREN